MRKLAFIMAFCLISMTFVAEIASAHVTVLPKETTQGSYEVITIRVPSEKEIPTVKIDITIPEDVEIARFEPKPDWRYNVTQDAAGKITRVSWEAEGNGLSAMEFGEFRMQGKIGSQSAQLVWKAYQTYKDGSKVEWTGAPDSDTPAPVMQAKPKITSMQGNDGGDSGNSGKNEGATLSFYFSIVALLAGLLSLGVSIKKR